MSKEPFSDWFNRQLARRDWSPADFIHRSEIPRSTVYSWSRGERVPGVEHVERIADVLMLDFDLVAEKSGIRPDIGDIDPDSNLAEILGLVRAVNWEDNEDRMDHFVPILRKWIERDRKSRSEDEAD